jgi:hypothetical protein
LTDAIEQAVIAIGDISLDRLRFEWAKRFGTPAPRCRSREVIRGLLAWRIQAEAYGGLSPESTRRLRNLTKSVERSSGNMERPAARNAALKPGTVLTREWRGALHKVHVLESGFAHDGRTYSSLSEIARAVTGTHWSGPRFFGLSGGKRARAHSVGNAKA